MIVNIPDSKARLWVNLHDARVAPAVRNLRRYRLVYGMVGVLVAPAIPVLVGITLGMVLLYGADQGEGGIMVAWLISAGLLIPVAIGRLALANRYLRAAKTLLKQATQAHNTLDMASHTYQVLHAVLYTKYNFDLDKLAELDNEGHLYRQIVRQYVEACRELEQQRATTEIKSAMFEICTAFTAKAEDAARQIWQLTTGTFKIFDMKDIEKHIILVLDKRQLPDDHWS